jgi:amidohydrolase
MQQIVARRVDPVESGVVTIGAVDAGTKHNIIAERALLKGTIRSFKPEVRQLILDELPKACSVARAMGGDFKLTVVEGYPPTVNDPDMTALVRDVGSKLLGSGSVLEAQAAMGAEDFSFLAQAAPGCFFRLGVHTPGTEKRRGHSPTFDSDEDALPIGSAMQAALATRFLNGGDEH